MIRDKYTYREDISRQRKYQLRKRDAQLCIICGNKAINSHYCEMHASKANELAKALYHRKHEQVVSA